MTACFMTATMKNSLAMWSSSALLKLLALLPTMLFGVMKYGLPALGVLFVTIITAIHSELLWQLIWKKKITVGDLSAVLTGLLLGLNLPADTPLWICSIGSFLAIILFKQLLQTIN